MTAPHFKWEAAPYRAWRYAQICDADGVGRLYVCREGGRSRVFVGSINGKATTERYASIDAGKAHLEELARCILEHRPEQIGGDR